MTCVEGSQLLLQLFRVLLKNTLQEPLAWFGMGPCCFRLSVAGLEYPTCAERDRDGLPLLANARRPDSSRGELLGAHSVTRLRDRVMSAAVSAFSWRGAPVQLPDGGRVRAPVRLAGSQASGGSSSSVQRDAESLTMYASCETVFSLRQRCEMF